MKQRRTFWGKITALICVSVLLVSLLAGCGGNSTAEGKMAQGAGGNSNAEGGTVQSGGTAQAEGEVTSGQSQNPDAITVTDLAGITHTFSQPLKKVGVQWSCAGGPFMTMSALLGEDIADYLACIDDSPEKYRADMWEQCLKDVPALKNVPVIGSADQELNLEGVLASGAEAFICPLELKKVMDDSLGARLQDAGIPVIYVDFHQETIENHTASTLLMGKLFDKENRAQEIVDFYVEHRNAVTAKIDEILKNQSRPNLYIEVGMMGASDFGNSFDNHYSWGGIAYLSGGNSIGEGVVLNLGPLDSEYVLSQNPDKIVFTGAYGSSVPDAIRLGYGVEKEETLKNMDSFFTRPGWSELSAYQNGQVYAINHGMAREMYDCACFEFFAKICFPEEFEALDPANTLEEYFSRFMPYTLDGLWFIY